jgi:hypothetical protein
VGYVPWADKRDYPANRLYGEARAIHAFFLRCEGLTFREIGDRLHNMRPDHGETVSDETARVLVMRAARQLSRAMRHTKWCVIKNDPSKQFDPSWLCGFGI